MGTEVFSPLFFYKYFFIIFYAGNFLIVQDPFLLYTSMDTHLILPRIIAAVLSLLDSVNLRNRVYSQSARISQLELAIEDIERINANSSNPNQLISNICTHSIKKPSLWRASSAGMSRIEF